MVKFLCVQELFPWFRCTVKYLGPQIRTPAQVKSIFSETEYNHGDQKNAIEREVAAITPSMLSEVRGSFEKRVGFGRRTYGCMDYRAPQLGAGLLPGFFSFIFL